MAYGLRVYNLDGQDIWGDEAWSIAISAAPLGESLYMEANPPFYFLLLRGTRWLWGSTPFGLRYLSVLCGVLAVAIIGRIAHQLANRHAKILTLFVAALSPFLIYYAQEARMYGPVLVGGAGSLLAFIRLQTKHSKWNWFAYITLSLIAIFSHYYSFALLFAQAIYVAIQELRAWRLERLARWMGVWMGMALLFLPFFLQHRRYWSNQTDFRWHEWSLANLVEIGERTLVAFSVGTTVSAEIRILTILLVGLALIAAIAYKQARLLLLVVSTGIIYAWVLTPILPFFWERYLLIVAPPFLALVGLGVRRINPIARIMVLVVLLAVTANALSNYHTDLAFSKGGYGKLMGDITNQAQAYDLLLLNGPLQQALFDYYQPEDIAHNLIPRDMLLDGVRADEFLSLATQHHRRVWLVESGDPTTFDPRDAARTWFAENGSFATTLTHPGVSASLFILDPPQTAQVLVNANLNGEVLLTGYALEADTLSANSALILTLFWEAQQPMSNAYTVFVHLLAEDGSIIAQADGQPNNGTQPTNNWQIGTPVRDSYALVISPDTPAGTYTLQSGMYFWPDLTRLRLLEDGQSVDDKVVLTTIRISDN